MALLSSGCRATVEGLPNIQNSSTTQQWQSYLAGWQLHVPCQQSSKHFISGQLKVIPLFRYSVIPYSAFYSVPSQRDTNFFKLVSNSVNLCELIKYMFCTLFLLFFYTCVYMYFYPFPSWATYYETLKPSGERSRIWWNTNEIARTLITT